MPLKGKVLITGGTGFLGRGILRRAVRDDWDCEFTILSRDEYKQAQCRKRYPSARYVLGDVTDTTQLANLMLGHDVIIHAAAMKYIPEGEANAYECVRVNVDGARSVVDAARAARVQRVVGISTDKAAQPVNTYGMTKALMERLFAEASGYGDVVFTTCRYGNVIGSTGSVVPAMRAQFKQYGLVALTDQYMTRFWMSVDDAVDTILGALDNRPGSTTVPKPKAASMHAIAYAVLGSLGASMYPPEGRIETDPRINIIGKRPGEKQHEDLISHYELFRTIKSDQYYTIMPPGSEDYENDQPTLSSDRAPTLSPEALCEMIRDSLDV